MNPAILLLLLPLVAGSKKKPRRRGTEIIFEEDEVVTPGGDYPLPDDYPWPDEPRPDEAWGEPDWTEEPAPQAEGQDLVRELCDAAGLDAGWTAFFEAAALGESGFNTLVVRGSPHGAPPWAKVVVDPDDAAAAARAYNRNAERYARCPWNAARYSFGSGGLWQLLPGNGMAAFWGTQEECMDPWAVFDPPASLVMIMEYCRRTMSRSSFEQYPTWGNLRVGMRNPSYMGRPDELDRQRYGKNKLGDRLEQLRYPRGFVDEYVTPLPPKDVIGLLDHLQQYA